MSIFFLDYFWDMYYKRPWVTILVAGTSLVLTTDIIYFTYKKFLRPYIPLLPNDDEDEVEPAPELDKPARDKIEEEHERERQLEIRKPGHIWNTVLFFPDPDMQDPESPTQQLISYFANAKMSIHLCVYLTSHPAMLNIIRKKYHEGLLVQVITDYDTFTAHNNYGPKQWRSSGMEVRMKATGFLMHHKFAVIDEEALITGSLNWTKQGMQHNQENVLITTNNRIVKKYMEEFYSLWTFIGETNY